MDPFVQRSLDEFGYAQVIAVLKRAERGLSTLSVGATPSVMDLFLPETPPAAAAVPRTRTLSASLTKPIPPAREFPRLGVAVGFVDQARAEALAAHPQVQEVQPAEPLSLIRPVKAAAAVYTKVSWGIHRIGAEKLWAEGLAGKGIRVGHLDTGVDGKHPALAGRIKGFVEFDFGGDRIPRSRPHDS